MNQGIEEATNSLNELERLAEDFRKHDAIALQFELEAAQHKKKARDIVEHQIPEFMEALGQEILRTSSGITIELKEQVFARIPTAKKQEAHQWLRDHQEGGMIKIETKESVHPQTLKAWARSKLEEGAEIPEELFGIYVKRAAKIK